MKRESRATNMRWLMLPVAVASLLACGGGGGSEPQESAKSTCIETGEYACKSGETEPLYALQWALNYAKSFFMNNSDPQAFGGGLDLNVEPVHRMGYKGQGVKVLVVDEGVDLENEDLKPNADYSMSWNFRTNNNDPMPRQLEGDGAHGTNVAGIIGAAQNGKGVMGIAPQVKIGGALWLTTDQTIEDHVEALGGAAWSQKADVINASYGAGAWLENYSGEEDLSVAALRAIRGLRSGKGVVYVKAAGNSFDGDREVNCGDLNGYFDCTNPSNDVGALETNSIVTAALNAKGQASSYSSAGSVVWITGMGGEYGALGKYGEKSRGAVGTRLFKADGPVIYSTDVRGCEAGYSYKKSNRNDFSRGESSLENSVLDNPVCDYSSMNGTSAAAPTISGVVALMLSANPDLTWRDVRDILRLSARKVDDGYEKRVRADDLQLQYPNNAFFDLRNNRFTAQAGGRGDVIEGAINVPVEFGWQMNAAGNFHSNWYGFGVPDAKKAVDLALEYKKAPERSKPSLQNIPAFMSLREINQFEYQKVSLIAQFSGSEKTVDAVQLRLSGEDICLGSVGIMVESPAGTKSYLKMPLDHFSMFNGSVGSAVEDFENFGLGSYAFYGESAQGMWKIYSVASNPSFFPSQDKNHPQFCSAAPATGTVANNVKFLIEARIIPQ